MTEIRDSWREVATKAESIGLKLRLHLEQEERPPDDSPAGDTPAGDSPAGDTTPGDPAPGTTSAGEGPGATRAAIDELGAKLKDAIDAFGAAAKDPAVRSDVADMGLLLKDALVATLGAVGAEVSEAAKGVGDAVRKTGTRPAGDTPPPPSPPPPPPGASDTVSDD